MSTPLRDRIARAKGLDVPGVIPFRPDRQALRPVEPGRRLPRWLEVQGQRPHGLARDLSGALR